MTAEQYRTYPKSFVMRRVTVDARDKNNRVERFQVFTTILSITIDGKQIADLFERRWSGEIDIRSIKCTMQMDILRCKTPEMVHKEIWTHLLAYNLLRTVMAVAAEDNDTGSGAGVRQYKAGTTDFGASDKAVSDKKLAGISREMVQIPMTGGAIAVAYNKP